MNSSVFRLASFVQAVRGGSRRKRVKPFIYGKTKSGFTLWLAIVFRCEYDVVNLWKEESLRIEGMIKQKAQNRF
jgi:hypothetical protein